MGRLTEAQVRTLKLIARRDYPAGEPRVSWINKATFRALKARGLVEERSPDIVHLSAAGRAALKEQTP